MSVSRREALRTLIAAPVAGAGAAKAIAEEAASLTGANVLSTEGPCPQPYSDGDSSQKLRWFRKHGIPDHLKAEMRRSSKWVSRLDPDLASLRSVSISNKIRIQRERSYLDSLALTETNLVETIQRDFFEKKNGWRYF